MGQWWNVFVATAVFAVTCGTVAACSSDSSRSSPSWSPDSTRIAFLIVDGSAFGPRRASVWIVDADGRHDHKVADVDPQFESLDWHPSRDSLLLTGPSLGKAAVLDLATGHLSMVAGATAYATWSRNGDAVLYYERSTNGSYAHIAEGHIADGTLEHDRDVGGSETFVLQRWYGNSVQPCRRT